jgi:hypothetical protein
MHGEGRRQNQRVELRLQLRTSTALLAIISAYRVPEPTSARGALIGPRSLQRGRARQPEPMNGRQWPFRCPCAGGTSFLGWPVHPEGHLLVDWVFILSRDKKPQSAFPRRLERIRAHLDC